MLQLYNNNSNSTTRIMGGAVSSGRNNNELIDNLVGGSYIRTKSVERVFRALDRGDYMVPAARDQAYKDLAWRYGLLHMSAPCIYSEVMEGLELRPGLSFLNIGSGTGYLSTLVGLILGSGGINHGVELYPLVVNYASQKLSQFLEHSPTLDDFDFCEPKYYFGNGLCLAPLQAPYDRVYCGAGCPEEYQTYFKQLIRVGGILVMPLNDELVQIKRVSDVTWVTRSLLNVSFATLRVPKKKESSEIVKLDEQTPPRLQLLARSAIRSALRSRILEQVPELHEPSPQPTPTKNTCPRRIYIPIEDEGDVEGLDVLHDMDMMDPGSGGREMNALLSLVLSMGRNRVTGTLGFPSTSESSSDDDDQAGDDDDADGGDDDDDDDASGGDDDHSTPSMSDLVDRVIYRNIAGNGFQIAHGGGAPRASGGIIMFGFSNSPSMSTDESGKNTQSVDQSTNTEQIEMNLDSSNSAHNSLRENNITINDIANLYPSKDSLHKNSKNSNENCQKLADDSNKDAENSNGKLASTVDDSNRDGKIPNGNSTKSAQDSKDSNNESKLTKDSNKDSKGETSKSMHKKRSMTKFPDNSKTERTVPSEVEIYLGKLNLPGTSSMQWEGSESKRGHESTDDECSSKKDEKRQKCNSGIEEENTSAMGSSPTNSTSKEYESETEEKPATSHNLKEANTRAGGYRRQLKRTRCTLRKLSSSTKSEESKSSETSGADRDGGEGGSESDSTQRRRSRPLSRDARRVSLSRLMKQSIKELPLPLALKRYINWERCYQF